MSIQPPWMIILNLRKNQNAELLQDQPWCGGLRTYSSRHSQLFLHIC
uniref:Alternative protein FGD4 n=1 Tax=Homo sapiens TaxID=9606 RepID=L8EAP1_HUMAN|nr:alternative protein FGD4 [Homo sapiens]